MANVVAHEAGHQLDHIYGVLLGYPSGLVSHFGAADPFQFNLTGLVATVGGGPINAGDVMTVTFSNSTLLHSGTRSPESVNYTVQSTDTLATIANNLAAEVNGDLRLNTAGITAQGSPGSSTFTVFSTGITTYTNSISAGSHELFTGFSYTDWPAFIALSPPLGTEPKCASNTGVFSEQYDSRGFQICGDLEVVSVGGFVTQNDQLTITFTDPSLAAVKPDHSTTETVTYRVLPGVTNLSQVATGIALAISQDPYLPKILITAFSAGTSVNITSATDETQYAENTSGATETLSLSAIGLGSGNTLGYGYFAYSDNSQILQAALPHYFMLDLATASWAELFAEETANLESRNSGISSPDAYFNEGFACTRFLVQQLELNGQLPLPTAYPPICLQGK